MLGPRAGAVAVAARRAAAHRARRRLPARRRSPATRAAVAGHRPAAAATAASEVGMLSRIAESLFWIGRYVERADDTARILDVHLQPAARGPVGRRGRGLPVAAARSWASDRPTTAGRTPSDVLDAARLRRRTTRARSPARWPRPGRTPAAPARRSPPRCGSASTSPGTRCRQRRRGRTASARTPVLACVRERAAIVYRTRRRDDEPRRGLAVPGARPLPRAGRHDRAAARRPGPRRGATPRRLADRCCAPAAPTRRSCAPTGVQRRARRTSPSSCCWTGCSRARCCTR